MNEPIIQLKGITKRYGFLKAVDDLHLSINKGEIFGLLGPNGAGKTTTILMMLGLTEPTSGTVQVCNYDATTQPIAVKKIVGYMPDSVGFYDGMTALDNLLYIGRLNNIAEPVLTQRAIKIMELVGLSPDMHKKTSTFSRGMKQRLGLAEVLIKQPEVIILDEPTLGIDPSGVKEFLQLIKALSKQERITVLLSSHHLHHVQQVCDRVGIFVGGKLLAEGNMDQLAGNIFNHEGHTTVVTLEENIQADWPYETEIRSFDAIQRVSVKQKEVICSCSKDITPDLVRFFVAKGYNITGVHKKSYGLDDIYQKYFENNLTGNSRNEKSRTFFQKPLFKKQFKN